MIDNVAFVHVVMKGGKPRAAYSRRADAEAAARGEDGCTVEAVAHHAAFTPPAPEPFGEEQERGGPHNPYRQR